MTATTQMAFDDDLDYEIVDGQKEAKMAGAKHGEICAQITGELFSYLNREQGRQNLFIEYDLSDWCK